MTTTRLFQTIGVLACIAWGVAAMWAPVAPRIMAAIDAMQHIGVVR